MPRHTFCLVLLLVAVAVSPAQQAPGKLPASRARIATELERLVRSHDYRALAAALANGDDPNPPRGKAPLWVAASIGDLRAVRMLLAAGANPNLNSNRLGAPLNAAVFSGNAAVVSALLRAGADPNGRGYAGCPAASTAESVEVLRLLVHAGADLELSCQDGLRALHGACSAANLPIVQFLLHCKVNVSARDALGNTPLIYACDSTGNVDASESVRLSIVKLLLHHGARADETSKDGLSAIEEAHRNHFVSIERVLRARTRKAESPRRPG